MVEYTEDEHGKQCSSRPDQNSQPEESAMPARSVLEVGEKPDDGGFPSELGHLRRDHGDAHQQPCETELFWGKMLREQECHVHEAEGHSRCREQGVPGGLARDDPHQ